MSYIVDPIKDKERAKQYRTDHPEKAKESVRKYYAKNKTARLAYHKQYRIDNSEKEKERIAEWYKNNKEKASARIKKWKLENKEKIKLQDAALRAKNKEKRACKESERRASKFTATPAWRNEFVIEEAFFLAKLREKICGGKWHVDHIVPLKSKLVCGLHVETNLRVIRQEDNISKGNRYWPDMPI